MTSPQDGPKRFLFTDIETTGLEPNKDIILEVAWAFTDENLEVVGTPRAFTIKPEDHQWSTIANRLGQNSYVREMHYKSGLWAALPSAETDFYEVEAVLQQDLRSVQLRPSLDIPVHLAGLSVHFDKEFLEYNGWDLETMGVHYRIFDLSAVKIMLDISGVGWERVSNAGEHRALNDVFEAIEQARIFRELFGRLPAV